jgi:hypothetical protein
VPANRRSAAPRGRVRRVPRHIAAGTGPEPPSGSARGSRRCRDGAGVTNDSIHTGVSGFKWRLRTMYHEIHSLH